MRTLLLCCAPLLTATPAVAAFDLGIQLDSVRCGRQVIEVGDRAWQIRDACGEPDFREVVEVRQDTVQVAGPDGERRLEVGVGSLRVVEEWIYRPRSGKLTRVMIVVGGVLTDIRMGDRN